MKQKLIFGTILLTGSGLICRLIGFLYRIFLSKAIGAEGMGIYQLILPIYYLSYAISTAGIQTSLSRLVAAATAKKEHTKATLTFLCGTSISFALALLLSVLIRTNAQTLGTQILGDSRCILLLNLLAYTLPFGAIHGCITGWFIGLKQVHIPAIMQIAEEFVRLAATYIFCIFLSKRNIEPTAGIAVAGMLFGEIISVLLSIFFINKHLNPHEKYSSILVYISSIRELLVTAFPLTINRIALNLLHSVEAILIPLSLQKYNLSQTESLEILGIISGMALPLVLFPTAIVNAFSSVLLPTISEQDALNNRNITFKLIKKTTTYAGVLGVICLIFFHLFGDILGTIFYENAISGQFISILSFISPFLFINIVLASVMNGLGKTYHCFFVNFINMCIRLSSIYFLIPQIGIHGYLWGLIGGEIICTFLSIIIVIFL